jgi:hypothetical protein
VLKTGYVTPGEVMCLSFVTARVELVGPRAPASTSGGLVVRGPLDGVMCLLFATDPVAVIDRQALVSGFDEIVDQLLSTKVCDRWDGGSQRMRRM